VLAAFVLLSNKAGIIPIIAACGVAGIAKTLLGF